MDIKVIFVNPNSPAEMDKFLPKLLAEALVYKIKAELQNWQGRPKREKRSETPWGKREND